MRFLARALGLFLAAGTFVAVIIDGTRSIADNGLVFLSVREAWAWLHAASLARTQAFIETSLSPFVWNDIALPVLNMPFAALLAIACALFFWLGEPPRSRIGYVTHL